jgi:uncharacterized membrane protein HdeD (DUF308 family)
MATSVPATATAYDELPWWLGLVQGVALLVLGVLALTAPGATLVVLVQLAGIYWLVTGVLGLVGLLGDRTSWLWRLIGGIVGVLAGLVVVAHPMWAAVLVPTTLILVVGIFGIVNGVLVLVQSFGARHWTGVALGLFSILLGAVFVMNPLIGAATLPFVIGILALVGGIMSIGVALSERGMRRRTAAAPVDEPAAPADEPAGTPASAPDEAAPAPLPEGPAGDADDVGATPAGT